MMSPLTWLITGCSSGFGESFVRQLRAAGDNVVATGRQAETKLAHLRVTGATIIDLDITASPEVISAVARKAWNIYPGGIDVIVNNAGYIQSGGLEELTQQELELSMKTNFFGPLNVTKAFLPLLRAKGSGTLFYMSSVAAWIGDLSATSYCASKFALEGAVECLAKELALVAPGIRVLMVEPGIMRTKVFSNISHVPPRVADYADFNAGTRAFETGVVGNEPGDAQKAVQIMIDLVKSSGVAAGKPAPFRLPLGSDAWGRIKTKCEETLRICEDWEDVARTTDFVPEKNA